MRRRHRISSVRLGAIAVTLAAFFGYLAFSKSLPWRADPYELRATFANATTLGPNSPVRIAGVNVGKVSSIEPRGETAEVTFSVEDEGRPIHRDATVKIRPRLFLEGNFFLHLRPGSPSAPELEDGGAIPITRTSTAVQLDEILTSLQSDSRENLKALLEEFGTGLASTEPGSGQDAAVLGESSAESLNDAFRHGGDAGKGSAITSQALLGRRPHDLSVLLAAQRKAFGALASRESELKDLVTNLNVTTGALAAESEALSESVRRLPPTLEAGRRAFFHLNRSFPSLRAFARDLQPGVDEIPGAIAAARPWLPQAEALLRGSELGGIASKLKDATPFLARATDRSLRLLPEIGLTSRCVSDILVPTGNVVIDNAGGAYPITTGQPNIREAFYSFVNLAGESQSYDGNGQYVRFQSGGGPQRVVAPKPGGGFQDNQVFGNTISAPLGNRPVLPGAKPPYRPDVPCDQNPIPDLNGAAVGAPTPAAVP